MSAKKKKKGKEERGKKRGGVGGLEADRGAHHHPLRVLDVALPPLSTFKKKKKRKGPGGGGGRER